ncbi:hypothetical protein Goklo_008320 [Gossypium klotzschianum]|uniref:RNase H type-1 domain-containing protein n=1 Tax=Gossypium klotzschianum TaxID=34286 RepID=A0A7J8V0B8_9ROSI|nr:hypothetical protein [Gossypium klotzschianum]
MDRPTAQDILTFGGLDGRLLNKDYFWCIYWMEDDIRLLDKKAMADFITTLWNSWNNHGFVIGGGYDFKDEKMLVDWVELYAFEESLKVARSLSIANAIFETDCVSLANMIKKHREDITIMGHHINDLFKTMDMFINAVVKWVNRNCN